MKKLIIFLALIVAICSQNISAQSYSRPSQGNDSKELIYSSKPSVSETDGGACNLLINFGPDTIRHRVVPKNYYALKSRIRGSESLDRYWRVGRDQSFGTATQQRQKLVLWMSANYMADTSKTLQDCLFLADELGRIVGSSSESLAKSWLDSALVYSKNFADTTQVLIRLGSEVLQDWPRVYQLLQPLSATKLRVLGSLYCKPHYVVELRPKVLNQEQFDYLFFQLWEQEKLTVLDCWGLISSVEGYENPVLKRAKTPSIARKNLFFDKEDSPPLSKNK